MVDQAEIHRMARSGDVGERNNSAKILRIFLTKSRRGTTCTGSLSIMTLMYAGMLHLRLGVHLHIIPWAKSLFSKQQMRKIALISRKRWKKLSGISKNLQGRIVFPSLQSSVFLFIVHSILLLLRKKNLRLALVNLRLVNWLDSTSQ